MPDQRQKQREEERKKRAKAEHERLRREEEKRHREEVGEESPLPRRGRPSKSGGVQTQELSPSLPAYSSISSSGGVHAPSQAPEVPAVAHVPPASLPIHSSIPSQQQSMHHISSQGCAHRMPGGVLTQEQSPVVSGLLHRSVPPTASPTLRKGPPSDSHGHMDVDSVLGDQSPIHHCAYHHPRQGMLTRRRGQGSWRAQLKRRHSLSGVREEHQAKRRQMDDERFLATVNLLQLLSISHPSRPISPPAPTSYGMRENWHKHSYA